MGCKVRGIEQGAAFRAGKRGSWRGSPRSFCLILSVFLPSYMGVYEIVGTSRPSTEIHFHQVNLCLRKFLCWTSADGVKGGDRDGVTNIIQEGKLLPLAENIPRSCITRAEWVCREWGWIWRSHCLPHLELRHCWSLLYFGDTGNLACFS